MRRSLLLTTTVFANISISAFSQCTDTVLYTPYANKIVHAVCESRFEGLYINEIQVDEDTYIQFTKLKDSLHLHRRAKENIGCYVIWFDDDSSKVMEGHFFGECFKGQYKSYYKNGNINEAGEFSESLYCARVGRWRYYNENGKLIREEFYTKSDIQEEVIAKYEYKAGTWSYWDEVGNLIKQEIYKDNQLVETKRQW